MKININGVIGLLSNALPRPWFDLSCHRDIRHPVPNTKRGKFKGHHRGKK